MTLEARPARTSEWICQTDSIFGKADRFKTVTKHRVRVKIGNNYFISTRDYPSAEAARAAAKRLEAKP